MSTPENPSASTATASSTGQPFSFSASEKKVNAALLSSESHHGEHPSQNTDDPYGDVYWEKHMPGFVGPFTFPQKGDRDKHAQDVVNHLRAPLEMTRYWEGQIQFDVGGKTVHASFITIFSDLMNRRSETPLQTMRDYKMLSWNLMGNFEVGGQLYKGNMSSLAEAVAKRHNQFFLFLNCDAYESLQKLCRYWALPLPGAGTDSLLLRPGNGQDWQVLSFAWRAVDEVAYRDFLDRWDSAEY